MEAAEYDRMARLEGWYWWYLGLRRLVSRTLQSPCGTQRGCAILDVGCGTGGGMTAWARAVPHSRIVGVDLAPQAVQESVRHGVALVVHGSANRLPFQDETFDAVVCLDLLCIQGVDDRQALQEAHRVLRPSGRLVINVPAFEWLRGGHDRAVHTRHRYRRNELRALLTMHGFALQRLQYWNALLLPVVFLARRVVNPDRGGAAARSDLRPLPGWANRLLAGVVNVDIWMCRALRVPFGASVFAVALKPEWAQQRRGIEQDMEGLEPAAAAECS